MKLGLFTTLVLVALMVNPVLAQSSASQWNLPVKISNTNTFVRFDVDTTWHVVEGNVGQPSGRIWLESATDPNSIRAELRFQVGSFDTGNGSRDKEMRTVMSADMYPDVTFIAQQVVGLCSPSSLGNGQTCSATLEGAVTIRNITKPITLPIAVTRRANTFEIVGKTSLMWNEFGVEDPSIFIARVDKAVQISFKISLPDRI